ENKEVARKLGWSPSKVSNMIGARRGASEADVASLLAMCGVGGTERDRLLRLTRESHQPGWWQQYGDRLPAELRTLIEHENSAVAITHYHSTLVPGLLQVADYVRAQIRASATIPADEIEERVRARLRRQEVFNRRYPARFRFFIDEYTVRRPGVDREIMSDQVHHLLRMAVRPHVEIRLIPGSVGFHAGHGGPFMLMEFAEINPVVYIENETSSLFGEQPESTRAYRAILRALAEVAFDEAQSRAWISRLARELSGHPEGAP
ncbi:MAG TPA: XRE family transcriptional regulator, partial [Micromonosporaceae bacterium]|nr:XRE family transcriptional regulator [Micromonosporaceae bacterium]